MMTLKRSLFLAFTLLWLLDATFTTMFILQYGVEMEANPFLRDLIAKFGLSALWTISSNKMASMALSRVLKTILA